MRMQLFPLDPLIDFSFLAQAWISMSIFQDLFTCCNGFVITGLIFYQHNNNPKK